MSRVTVDIDFASRLRRARDLASLTQAELADRLGVSTRTIQGWEGDTSFPQPKQRRIAVAFIAEQEAAA